MRIVKFRKYTWLLLTTGQLPILPNQIILQLYTRTGSTSVIRIVCGTTHMNMPVQNRIKSIALKMLRVIEVCAKPDGAFKVVVQMSTKKLKIEEAECR
jgi:hypothetical protein